MTKNEAMQRLIDALDKNDNYEQAMALADIRAALAQPEPEPVAVWELQEDGWDTIADPGWMEALPIGTKLYTAPPQREWVGLTYKERCELWNIASQFLPESVIMHDFAKDIEARLRELNDGLG